MPARGLFELKDLPIGYGWYENTVQVNDSGQTVGEKNIPYRTLIRNRITQAQIFKTYCQQSTKNV